MPERQIADINAVLTVVGGKVVYGEGKYAGLAPAATKVAPDWLPISRYPGFPKTDVADDGVQLAAAALGEAMPTIIGQDGVLDDRLPCGLL